MAEVSIVPDNPLRDELERKLGRELGKLNQVQLSRLLEHLGDPPRMENVPAEFWQQAGADFLAVIQPFLEKLYLDQAAEFLGSQSIGVNWALVNQAASDWASNYSFELVTRMTATNQAALQTAVSNFYQAGQTIGGLEQAIAPLRDSLGNLYGPVRAEMIAVTEVTRATSAGEHGIVDQILRDNPSLQAVAVWQTSNDERVCLICKPRNGKSRGNGWTEDPPAHPRCRCWLNHKMTVRHA